MKELSNETRLLLATVLSVLVIAVWGYFYKIPIPPKPTMARVSSSPAPQAANPAGEASGPSAAAAPVAEAPPARAATGESTFVVENDLYRVTFSNRGAVARSWELTKVTDDKGATLDLIHSAACQQLGGWPLSLALEDSQVESVVNNALYEVTPAVSGTVHAPAEVEFAWSDGRISVTKRLKFSAGFLMDLEVSVLVDGKPVQASVAWRGGFGDSTAFKAADQVRVVQHAENKLTELDAKKLGSPGAQEQRVLQSGQANFAGIADHYFAAIFLPSDPLAGNLLLRHWKLDRKYESAGKEVDENVAEMSVGSAGPAPEPLRLRLFVGPKDLDILGRIKPPLTDLVQFGWLTVIAKPLLALLKWIHRYATNWGWAIVLMTVLINIVLFPLKLQGWRSMQRMQKVAPEVKQIQDRYKKYSMRDPRKQEMQTEVMAVYKREGINPAGGCLPMAIQMPIWYALYRMLSLVYELRHAAWALWLHDLSAPDPYYILPILMGVTMYIMQKMTPMTTTDPAQQRMMTLMPVMFGGMFVIFPIASGLVLYILTSNVVNMVQQVYLNRSGPGSNPDAANGNKKQKKKK